jgi:Tfp pilus assembly protein PilN
MMISVSTAYLAISALISLSYETVDIILLDKPTASPLEIGSTIVNNVFDIVNVDLFDHYGLLFLHGDEKTTPTTTVFVPIVDDDVTAQGPLLVGSFETMFMNGTPIIPQDDSVESEQEVVAIVVESSSATTTTTTSATATATATANPIDNDDSINDDNTNNEEDGGLLPWMVDTLYGVLLYEVQVLCDFVRFLMMYVLMILVTTVFLYIYELQNDKKEQQQQIAKLQKQVAHLQEENTELEEENNIFNNKFNTGRKDYDGLYDYMELIRNEAEKRLDHIRTLESELEKQQQRNNVVVHHDDDPPAYIKAHLKLLKIDIPKDVYNKKWKKLSVIHHPDKNVGCTEAKAKMQEINNARAELKEYYSQ